MLKGKKYRLKRLFNKSGKVFLVAMDHGTSMGPVCGIDNIRKDLNEIVAAKPDGIILHKGLVKYLDFDLATQNDVSVVIHLMASTNKSIAPNDKRLVCTVEEAIEHGADAVSIHINVGAKAENDMLEIAGRVSRKCSKWQLPLIGMFYPRGPQVEDPSHTDIIAHAARLAAELNIDIVKTKFTFNDFSKVVKGAEIPVIMAGGKKVDKKTLLQNLSNIVKKGGAGAAIGRNVFQSPLRKDLIKAINAVLHQEYSPEEALELI